MTPLRILKLAVTAFAKERCKYCLVGGHAASLYRSQERMTKDVDFALLADPIDHSRKTAERVVTEMNLTPMIGFIPHGSTETARKSVCMVTSTPQRGEMKGIIDILLPELPWVAQGVRRAQNNLIDLGFAKVPVITPEDLILAKCYALNNSPDRFQDLDDLKEIFISIKELDLDYLRANLAELALNIPEPVKKFAPKILIW